MFKVVKIIALFFLCNINSVYSQIPVILRVTSSEQNDSIGCNIVQEICDVAYTAIISGKAKLWDSPSKEIQIFPTTLIEIEKSSKTNFTDQELIYIYEFWENANSKLLSNTTGFLFSNKSSTGEDVAYGYLEYKDVQDIFLRTRVKSNANGNFNSNLVSYLSSKNYNYKFLQFAGKVIDNVSASQNIKDNYIGGLKFNTNDFSSNEIPQKAVNWVLETKRNTVDSNFVANDLINQINIYLHSNEEIFYNLDENKRFSHLHKKEWKVTGIKVSEIWKKINGEIFYDPISIIIFINDSALQEIPFREMVVMDIRLNDETWIDVIKKKKFFYSITKINADDVSRVESYQYLKALQTYSWNRVTEFVKYY